jgi:hypothetical protein
MSKLKIVLPSGVPDSRFHHAAIDPPGASRDFTWTTCVVLIAVASLGAYILSGVPLQAFHENINAGFPRDERRDRGVFHRVVRRIGRGPHERLPD